MIYLMLLLTAFIGSSQAEAVKMPLPETELLANGLKVQWYFDDRLPLIDVQLSVLSGNRDDLPGKAGTAELLANVLDRGAGGLSAAQLVRAIEELGADHSISSDDDTFSFGIHGLAQDSARLIELFGKMVTAPTLSESEVNRERERLLERWSHLGDYAESMGALTFHRLTTRGTDYARGNFVSRSQMKSIKKGDLLRYYREHFVPGNAILTVLGKFDRKVFGEQIKAQFESWKGPLPKRSRTQWDDSRLPHSKNSIVLVDRPGLNQVQVRIGFKAPLITSPDHYPLRVGNALLGEYFNSRLNTLIRDQLGLTYGISSSFAYSKEFAHFVIGGSTRNETVGELISQVIGVLKDLKMKGPSEREVATAQEYLVGGFPLSVASLGDIASRRLSDQIFGLPVDYLDLNVSRLRAVTHAQVVSALAQHLDLKNLVVVVAGDFSSIKRGLSPEQRRKLKRVNLKSLLD